MAPHAPDNPERPANGLTPWEELIQQRTKPTDYLGRWVDTGLRLSRDLTEKSIREGEIGRIHSAKVIVLVAWSIPRRLGSDASDVELALDKRRARRVAHALDQSLLSWTKKPPKVKPDENDRRAGAQLDWIEFVGHHALGVQDSLRLVATWSMRNDQEVWGRSAVVRLNNELHWVSYALRD